VANKATVSIVPNPLTITLPVGAAVGLGTVTFTNTAGAGGSQLYITADAVTGSAGILNWFFLEAADTCTGAVLAPGQSCTVEPVFVNILAARGVNRAGAVTFTDNGAGSPQSGALVGHGD
jgi:hypothetical protein